MSLVPVDQADDPGPPKGLSAFLCGTCAIGLASAFLFSAFPGFDLVVSRLFYEGNGQFWFQDTFIVLLRNALRVGFGLACFAAFLGIVMLAFFNRKLRGLGLAAWLYVGLCAAVGPGLVANLGFKEYWDRARPVHITQFGGEKQFTPAMLRADQCETDCSFISGEASNYYALGFAFAFLFGAGAHWRAWFAGAIAAGSFAGLLRIGLGAHFLSDVVFAGIFMALVTAGLAWLVLGRWSAYLADDGPVHRRTLRVGARVAVGARQLGVRLRHHGRTLITQLRGRSDEKGQ